jgi:hypothetical protein
MLIQPKLIQILVLLCVCFILAFSDQSEAMNKKTKYIVGASMMAVGTVLSIGAVQDFDVFSTSSADEVKLGMGLGLIGAGTVFLVLGAIDKGELNQDSDVLREKRLQTIIGVAPTRGGICGSVNFRW